MALLWSLAVFLTAFVLQLLVWRVRTPRRHARAIVIVFLVVLVAYLSAFALIQGRLPGLATWLPACPGEGVRLILLVLSLLAAYVITYSALEADSPTLIMVRELGRAGAEGLDRDRFHRSMNDAALVIPRVEDLLRDGMARLEGARYVLTFKGRLITLVIMAHRQLMARGAGG